METVSSEGDLYLYSLALTHNDNFLKGFNGWRLYLLDEYQGIIDVQGGGCGCGGCGCWYQFEHNKKPPVHRWLLSFNWKVECHVCFFAIFYTKFLPIIQFG